MEIKPVVIIDTREELPWTITDFPSVTEGLSIGDYGIKGFSDWNNPRFIVERKSLSDLVYSLTRRRKAFYRELEKMRKFQYAAVLIEANRCDILDHKYRSKVYPESILQTLNAIMVRQNIHCVFCGDREGAIALFQGLVRQFCRGVVKEYKTLLRSTG